MDFAIPTLNLTALLPEIILVATALIVLMADVVIGERRALSSLSLAGVLAAGAATAWLWTQPDIAMQNMAVSDNYARFVKIIILVAAGLGILLSSDYISRISEHIGEYYALLLFASAGMMVMGAATDLITIFLGLEIFSLSLYVLAGFNRSDARSGEASLKYFLLGAFASAFFLYGIALLYGATGTTNLTEMALARVVSSTVFAGPYLLAGMGLLMVGFGFKVALVPFQQWTPDVYQGAPTPVTAFMSVGAKTAGFIALARVLMAVVPASYWGWALAALAVLTMTLGNLAALRQSSLKRMLAYSSIAHAGYVAVGLTAGTATGVQSALFYLFVYAFMNIGAFGVLVAIERAGEGDIEWTEARGLSARRPLLAAAMAIFMLSLTGIPPLAGFFGKLYLFSAAVQTGWAWLAVIAMLNSVISAYYYLRVVVAMYMTEPEPQPAPPLAQGLGISAAVALAALGTLIFGLWSSPWLRMLAETGVRLASGE